MQTDLNVLQTMFNSPWFILAIVWSLVWKAIALWVAARKGSKVWYVVLLLINFFGILEIFYIFIFSKMSKNKELK